MKKMFLVLALLMFASQAVAGTVTLTLIQDDVNYPAESRIGALYYTADADVSGFGLNITVDTADANIVDINNYFVGECDGSNKGFGIFPASFSREIDAGNPNWDDPNYSPVAANTDAGASGTGLGTGTIIIEMGALYEDGNKPATTGLNLLCRFQVDGDCNVTVTGDATRGNVVLADGNAATLNTTAATSVYLGAASGPNTVPVSWETYPAQCKGDADGNGTVELADFFILKDSYNESKGDSAYDPRADFDRNGTVELADFFLLKDNYNTSPSGTCPAGDINGIYCP